MPDWVKHWRDLDIGASYPLVAEVVVMAVAPGDRLCGPDYSYHKYSFR